MSIKALASTLSATSFAVLIGACPWLALAQQAYEVTDLGTLGGSTANAYGLNSSGQVVGSSTTAGDAATHAFLYGGGTMTDLGTLGGTTSVANAINTSGQVAGTSSNSSGALRPTLWSGGTPTDLGSGAYGSGYAYGINDEGEVVGSVNGGGCYGGYAALWYDGLDLLPTANAGAYGVGYAIDNAGSVAGCSANLGAYWYAASLLIPLNNSIGTQGAAYAFNDNGLIVGQGNLVSLPIATTWTIPPGTYAVSATSSLPGASNAYAYGVNNAGQIVGSADATLLDDSTSRAILWLKDGTVSIDLNATLRPQVALANTLTEARAVNANGLIIANGSVTATGARHAYLLTPVAVPGTPTAALSASASSVQPGQSFTLTWSSTNAWGCVAGGSGPAGPPWSGVLATSGAQMVAAGTATGTITATLSCSFGNARSATRQVTVAVMYPALTVTLSAKPTAINAGQSTTLTWASTNATTCAATGGGTGDGWSGTKQPTSGSVTVTEPGAVASPITVTFTLTCSSSKTGQFTPASTKVTVDPLLVGNAGVSGGGGGATDVWSLVGIIGVFLSRRHVRSPIHGNVRSSSVSNRRPRSRLQRCHPQTQGIADYRD